MKLRFLGVAVTLAVTQVAFGWNELGHMVAASLAYSRLSLPVKAECDRLLLIGGNGRAQTFVDAGPWADDVRRDRPETGPWHYIDYHFRADGKPTPNKPDAENVEVELARQSSILKDHSKSDAERADALRFIIHFVGDSHQPLHCVSRDSDAEPNGDKGGNDFKILAPEGVTPKPKNLHALWDEGCGLFGGKRLARPLSSDANIQVTTLGEELMAKYGHEVDKQAKILDPHVWTQEGLALAKSQVYNVPEGGTPSPEYLQKGQEISGKRIVLAGLRLARYLNKILG